MGNSKSRYRKDLLFLDAAKRIPVRTEAVVHADKDAAEVEAVGVVAAVRSGRPIGAVVASMAGSVVVVIAAAGSREEHLRDY